MSGRFEVFQGGDGRWRFRLKSANGEVVACSASTAEGRRVDHYASKDGARDGCAAVMAAARDALIVTVEE